MFSFTEVYEQMKKQNETAAVDMYSRMFIGGFGLLAVLGVFIFGEGIYKFLGFIFLVFPLLLVVIGLWIDFSDAKRTLNYRAKSD